MPICRVCSPGKAGIATPLTLTAPSGARQKAGRRHSCSVFGPRVSAVMATACGGFYLLGTLRIVVVVVVDVWVRLEIRAWVRLDFKFERSWPEPAGDFVF